MAPANLLHGPLPIALGFVGGKRTLVEKKNAVADAAFSIVARDVDDVEMIGSGVVADGHHGRIASVEIDDLVRAVLSDKGAEG